MDRHPTKTHQLTITRNLTQSTTESLISGSLASDKCYVKCVDDVEKEWTTVCSTKSSHNESRYCPEQAPYRGCQYQCWVLKPTLSHEKPLPGTDKLSAWNLTLPGFMKTTYENSLKHGNTYTAPSEYAGSDILSLEKDLIGDHAALTLPTCISETNVITDYEKSPLLGGMMWGRDQRFPCQCGDWKSSGTAAFMYQLGLAPGQRDYESGVADELLLSICKYLSVLMFCSASCLCTFLSTCPFLKLLQSQISSIYYLIWASNITKSDFRASLSTSRASSLYQMLRNIERPLTELQAHGIPTTTVH